MRLTKQPHASVRIEHEGTTVVVDPGIFCGPGDVEGADAILITHEHVDHYNPDLLGGSDAPIFTIEAVANAIRGDAPAAAERITVVRPDDAWDIGPIGVRAVGELHAVIHEDLPRFHNSGYLLHLGDQTVFHPGDALTAPEEHHFLHDHPTAVDVLLAPVSAPWMRISEGIDFARRVGARRSVAIHDRIYTEVAHGIVDNLFGALLDKTGQEFVRLGDGQDLPTA